MHLLRRKSHDAGENRERSPSSEMKRRNHANHDDISADDTAELSAESAERHNILAGSFRRKSTEHIGDVDTTIRRNVSLAENSMDDNSLGRSGKVRQRRNKPMHKQCDMESDVEFLDLKDPAPMEPNLYTKEEFEAMINEYESEIIRLEKLNATLSANVAALYAENAAAEEELCHHGPDQSLGSKPTSMEMSPNEEYAPLENDMILTEDQYLHEIAKHQKTNSKLKKQLETQKKLVSKLSLHLKTSADKITALIQEKDGWKTKAENPNPKGYIEVANKAQEDQVTEVHKYQIQVIQNELVSLQNLMTKNASAHRRDRQKLLEEYRSEDALWTSKLERPMDTMKRIIRSVTENNGGIDDAPAEADEEAKPVAKLEKKESTGNTGFNILDSVTSLFGQNQQQQTQIKVQVDEHPLSNEIKTFDVSRLKKTAVVLEGSLSKLVQEDDVVDEPRENFDEETSVVLEQEEQVIEEITQDVSDRSSHGEIVLDDNEVENDPNVGETEPFLEDEGEYVEDSDGDNDSLHEEALSGSHLAGEASNNVIPAGVDCGEGTDGNKGNDDQYSIKAPTFEGGTNEDEVDSSDEDSMYEVLEGKYVAREGKDRFCEQSGDGKGSHQVDEAGLSIPMANNTNKLPADASQVHSSDYNVDNDSQPCDNYEESNEINVADEGDCAVTSGSKDVQAVRQSVAIKKEECSSSAEPEKSNDESLDSCETKQEDKPTELPQVDFVPNPSSSMAKRNDSGSISMGTYNTVVTGVTNGTQVHVAAAKEDKTATVVTEDKTITSITDNHNEDKQTAEDDKEDEKSLSHYQNVISQFTTAETSSSKWSKNSKYPNTRLSRKELFQREGLSCSDLFLDVVNDVFHSPEERKVLIASKNGRDFVPPYEPPAMPPERKKDAPQFKRGMNDGFYMYKSSSGNEYSGHWKGGRRHGYGMAKYRDGEVFHGDWRRGRRHGHGVLYLANKDVFDGDWDTNQKHGLGVYYWADGEVDISWYDKDTRLESVRWNKDRRLAYLLDLKGSKREQISLNKAAKIVRGWEKKAEVFDC